MWKRKKKKTKGYLLICGQDIENTSPGWKVDAILLLLYGITEALPSDAFHLTHHGNDGVWGHKLLGQSVKDADGF